MAYTCCFLPGVLSEIRVLSVKSTMQETIYSLYCHRPCKWVNISERKDVILEVTKSAVVLLCTHFIGIRHNHRGKYYSTGLNTGFL